MIGENDHKRNLLSFHYLKQQTRVQYTFIVQKIPMQVTTYHISLPLTQIEAFLWSYCGGESWVPGENRHCPAIYDLTYWWMGLYPGRTGEEPPC